LRAVGFTRVLVGVGVTVTVGVAVTVLVVVTVGAECGTAAAVLAGDGAADRVADEQPAVSATARTAVVRRERIFGPFKLGS
jgi:ABC-type dipeptide/oligopeptide/nickel transport system permease subunit